jgi:hypothetical protein
MTNPESDKILIRITKKQTHKFPQCCKVRVQVDLGGRQGE